MWKRFVVVVVFLLVGPLLVSLALTDNLQCFNFFYGWIGRWDWNMERCQASKLHMRPTIDSSSALEQQTYNSVLARIAFLHTMMRDYDQALDVYEHEMIPRFQKDEGDTDTSLDMGLVLGHVSDIYRIKAHYRKGLDKLTEARTKLLSGGSSVTKTLLLTDNGERFKDMQYLLDAVKEQDGYTAALVGAAKRYNFYGRSQNAAAADCPPRATKRFQIPPDIVFYVSIGLIVYGAFVFIKRQPREQRIKRGTIAGAVVIPLLYLITLVWGMTQRSSVEQLNALASIFALVGKHDTALQLYDEARCDILANPLEESILTGDAGIETFTGPILVYIKLQSDDLVDALAETIHELVELNSLLGTNILVASYYLSLSIAYSDRGAQELADTYAGLAQREMDRLVQRTEEEINSLLSQPPIAPKGNESSSPDKLLDKTYYEL
jgi:tetratricopeptide (TPR) repeat protein